LQSTFVELEKRSYRIRVKAKPRPEYMAFAPVTILRFDDPAKKVVEPRAAK
jgi:hypothetical protein